MAPATSFGEKRLFFSLSDYLRKSCLLTGTKVVCAEGDCGACTVLKGFPTPGTSVDKLEFHSINSCITFMYLLDGCHIVTVEGLEKDGELSEVQKQMVENNGASADSVHPVLSWQWLKFLSARKAE